MKMEELGINPNRGGCALVLSGTVIKNEPWSMVDETTKEQRSGHSFHLAYFGGTAKVRTENGDPLRNIGVGEEINLKMPAVGAGTGMKQSGTATLIK